MRRAFTPIVVLVTLALFASTAWAESPVQTRAGSKTGVNHNSDTKTPAVKVSTNKFAGKMAIANILSSNTSGFTNKIAIAIPAKSTKFVMGHGSGGMGFKGTGTTGEVHKTKPEARPTRRCPTPLRE